MSSSPTRRSPARIASNSNNGASTSNNTPSNSQSATSISNKRALESPGDDGTAAKKACPDDRAIALPFLDMMGTEIVEINVGKGPNQRLFRVYQKRLCDKVPYFQKMFEGGWKESIEKKITLEDDDPASFDKLLLWVYTDVIPKIEWSGKSAEKGAAAGETLNLYVLADKLSLVWLMDEIASEYIDSQAESSFLPGSSQLGLFYTKLSDHMAFRKYAAYCLHYILHGLKQTERNLQIWPAAELNQVMADNPTLTLEYLELVRKHPHQERAPDPRTLSRCTFHQHISDEPCTLTGGGDNEVDEEAWDYWIERFERNPVLEMTTSQKHVDNEGEVEKAAKGVTKREQIKIDTEPTEARRGYPVYITGGDDYKGKGKVYGVVVCEQYSEEGCVVVGEEYVDTGPQREGFTVISVKDDDTCMIAGGTVRFIR